MGEYSVASPLLPREAQMRSRASWSQTNTRGDASKQHHGEVSFGVRVCIGESDRLLKKMSGAA